MKRFVNRALLFKCVNEAWWLFVALAVLLFSFCWLRVWIISLLDMPDFGNMLGPLVKKFGHLSPVPPDHILTYPGRVALTLVEPVVVFGLSIWAISRGSDIVAGEIGRGSMEMLLGQPLSRLQVFVTQACVTVGGIVLLCAVCTAGIWGGIRWTEVAVQKPITFMDIFAMAAGSQVETAPEDKEMQPLSAAVNIQLVIPGIVNVFAMAFGVAGLTTFVSSWDRYRWRTVGIASGLYILQFIIKLLAISAEQLLWLKPLSFFSAFEPQWFVYLGAEQQEALWSFTWTNGEGALVPGAMACNAMLLGIGLIGYVGGAVTFCQRDLPAPI